MAVMGVNGLCRGLCPGLGRAHAEQGRCTLTAVPAWAAHSLCIPNCMGVK